MTIHSKAPQPVISRPVPRMPWYLVSIHVSCAKGNTKALSPVCDHTTPFPDSTASCPYSHTVLCHFAVIILDSRFGMVFYNNLLTTCLLTPAAFMVGDFGILMATPQLHTAKYILILLFSGEGGTATCCKRTCRLGVQHRGLAQRRNEAQKCYVLFVYACVHSIHALRERVVLL